MGCNTVVWGLKLSPCHSEGSSASQGAAASLNAGASSSSRRCSARCCARPGLACCFPCELALASYSPPCPIQPQPPRSLVPLPPPAPAAISRPPHAPRPPSRGPAAPRRGPHRVRLARGTRASPPARGCAARDSLDTPTNVGGMLQMLQRAERGARGREQAERDQATGRAHRWASRGPSRAAR